MPRIFISIGLAGWLGGFWGTSPPARGAPPASPRRRRAEGEQSIGRGGLRLRSIRRAPPPTADSLSKVDSGGRATAASHGREARRGRAADKCNSYEMSHPLKCPR